MPKFNYLMSLFFLLLLTGCSTFEGAGKDVERLGEEIQEEAKE